MEIRNALEYGKDDLIVNIIVSILKNRKIELKFEFRDSKSSERLNMKEKLNQNKSNNFNNYNSYKKGKFQNLKFKDKNENQGTPKNKVKKRYYCEKMGQFIKDCFKKASDIKINSILMGLQQWPT